MHLQVNQGVADKYLELGLPLHMLINNAGVFLVPHDHTQEGFEVPLLSSAVDAILVLV